MKLPSRSPLFLGCVAALALGVSACGDDDAPAPVDAGSADTGAPDAGRATRTTFPGLDGPVEVVRDERGMVHIYATTLHDATFVQGYVMAVDRYPQMELTRRFVTGRVAEFNPTADASTVNDDIEARWVGHARNAELIYATLAEGSPEKTAIDAFAAGVSLYIDDLIAERVDLPRGTEVINFVISSGTLNAWRPQDSLAIGRYLSHALSYGANDEIGLTRAREAIAREFPAGDPRAGIFSDFWAFEPVEAVFTRDGIPNLGTDTGTRALRPPRSPGVTLPPFRVDPAALASAERFFEGADGLMKRIAPRDRGSNNWVVSGSKTATGHSLLMNDPHLSLDNPPLFWFAHLNTKRDGGTDANFNVSGLSLIGVPGIIIGYNDDVAWGVTTANHDVTDVYQETITDGGAGPDTVLFNGAQVPLETVTETINVATGAPVTVTFERVPHHGFLVPEIRDGNVVPRTAGTALSVRWTGNEPSSELSAFLRLNTARSLDEARDAIQLFEVGAQNFVMVERGSDDIVWSTQSRVPVRPAECLTWDATTGAGLGPMFVYPGDGTCEWAAEPMADRYIPHDVNPARGFLATANQDLVGVTRDGNPVNDGTASEPFYIGWDYDIGHRQARIANELTRLTERGGVTVDEMKALQGDLYSPLGALLAGALVTSLEHAAEEAATPGTHPELADELSDAGPSVVARVELARERLAAWRFTTPPAVEGMPTNDEIAESVATTLFNAAITRLTRAAFKDETDRIGRRPWGQPISKTLQWALLDPTQLATYDAAIGDTILWDDLTTTDAVETRDELVLRAFVSLLDALEMRFGTADLDAWRWGRLHTLRLASVLPVFGTDFALPRSDSTEFPDGYPRHGDLWGVDASNYDLWTSRDDYAYSAGPQQRLVVEMTDTGPKIWNALPGAQVLDARSPYFGAEIEFWRNNEAPPLYYTDADIEAHVDARTTYTPE